MSTALPGQERSLLAQWRWYDGLVGLMAGLSWSVGVLLAYAQREQFWLAIIEFWRSRLGLSLGLTGSGHAHLAMPLPSDAELGITTVAVVMAWVWAGFWAEPKWPLRVLVRALCLVQGSACVFFALAPARFPYGLGQHLDTLLTLGAHFMVAIPLMLGMGWGVLRLPWPLKWLAPPCVLMYFALWLPHQVLLHAWVLSHASALFMPLLFLCFGLLLDGWLFIALYAWLASLTPRVKPVRASAW